MILNLNENIFVAKTYIHKKEHPLNKIYIHMYRVTIE